MMAAAVVMARQPDSTSSAAVLTGLVRFSVLRDSPAKSSTTTIRSVYRYFGSR